MYLCLALARALPAGSHVGSETFAYTAMPQTSLIMHTEATQLKCTIYFSPCTSSLSIMPIHLEERRLLAPPPGRLQKQCHQEQRNSPCTVEDCLVTERTNTMAQSCLLQFMKISTA